VAEGVEDETQLHRLQELGVDEFQGYYFSKPVTKEEFA
ncbi:EAL domain-containing protein, partial [Vibrio furnissii]